MKPQDVSDLPRLPARKRDSHKGDFGRILIVGGSAGMIGAPALAANAALRAGAGLVTVAAPSCVQQTIASLAWCATSIALPSDAQCISADAIVILREAILKDKRFDAVAVGPGLGLAQTIAPLIEDVVRAKIPIVVDADALSVLSQTHWHGKLAGPCVITPHPGELGRLLNRSIADIQADRPQAALDAVEQMTNGQHDTHAVCVLKGVGTIVTDGRRLYTNSTGNPGMASGGTGDVLTGIIAAMIGQGLSTMDAAVLAVHVHGLAGDLAEAQIGEVSLMAEDLLSFLPDAFQEY